MITILFWNVGILLGVLGILINKISLVDIIAGYDEKSTKDKKGLARWVGNNLLIMGLLTICLAVLANWISQTLWLVFLFIAIIVGLSIRTAIGTKRYEKSE